MQNFALIEVNWKKKKKKKKKKLWHRAQPVQRILWVVIFFDVNTDEKNTIYRSIKYFVS